LSLEGGDSRGERRGRKHDINGHAQFRFKAASQALCPSLEQIDIARHRARRGEQCATLVGEDRQAGTAIEQLHSELPFQIRQGLADHRLRAPQAATSRRETFLIRRSDEGAELIQ